MTKKEMFASLLGLGYSVPDALMVLENGGTDSTLPASDSPSDKAYARTMERMSRARRNGGDTAGEQPRSRKVTVPLSRRHVTRGPMFEYFAKPVRKGAKITIAAGNNTDVYKALSRKALSVPQIAAATGISPHSVESSVYQLRTAGLVDKRPISR